MNILNIVLLIALLPLLVLALCGAFLFLRDCFQDARTRWSRRRTGKPLIKFLLCMSLVVPAAFVVPLVTSCSTSQQTTSYNTLYSLEHTTVAAYDGYVLAVIKGQASTNGLPAISKSFNQFQAAMAVAVDAVQNSTNALAPPALAAESADLINLISQFKK